MTHYSNFIILVVQLLLVHSDSNYIYQKLWTTTIRAEVPYVVHLNKNPRASYSNAFFEPRTITIDPRYKIIPFRMDIGEIYRRREKFSEAQKQYINERCFYEEGNNDIRKYNYGKRCSSGSQTWCCSSTSRYCGYINCQCCKSLSDKSNLYRILGVSLTITVFIICAIICISLENFQHVSSAMSPTIRLPRTDNRSLPSIEPRPTENNNSNGRRARRISIEQHISSSPPKYDDTMRQNSVTITMQQQSLLPPSYDDFMQRNNRKEETTSSL